MPAYGAVHREENEKYLYRHGQTPGWNVSLAFFGDGPDQPPSIRITAYFGDSAFDGDEEKSKKAAREFRNMACRQIGLPVPRLSDRFRKHAPPHWLVAGLNPMIQAARQRRAGSTHRRYAKA